MADSHSVHTAGDPHSPSHNHQANNECNSSSGNNLQYPQLLLEASLHSLLSHSYSSSASTVINMTRSNQSLSESWATLSDADYSQDDDLQSELTDTGSLLEASSSQDVHSVNDGGGPSDTEEQKEIPLASQTGPHAGVDVVEDDYSVVQSYNLPSAVLSSPAASLERNSDQEMSASAAHVLQSDPNQSKIQDESDVSSSQVWLPLAKSSLALDPRPFHVLYLGGKSVSGDTRDFVFGKIGAALVANRKSSNESSHFNIIPLEFGPGSTSESSELIPALKQLAIHELEISKSLSTDADVKSTSLQLIDGRVVRFTQTHDVEFQDDNDDKQWIRPDLILCIASEQGLAETDTATKVLNHAQQHLLPVLILVQERTSSVWPQSLTMNDASIHKYSTTETLENRLEVKMPISVDDFISIDAERLNRHLQYLYERSVKRTKQAYKQLLDKQTKFGISSWLASLKTESDKAAESPGTLSIAEKARYTTFTPAHLWKITKILLLQVVGILILYLFHATLFSGSNIFNRERPTSIAKASTTSASLTKISSSPAPASKISRAEVAKVSTSSDPLRFTGMLHDVAEYLPLGRSSSAVVRDGQSIVNTASEKDQKASCTSPDGIVSLRRGGVLVVPEAFFAAGQFNISVKRGRRNVPHKVDNSNRYRFGIKVAGRELHGLLKVSLSISKPSCRMFVAEINLKDTPMVELADIATKNQINKDDSGERQNPTDWTLIRVRKVSSGWTGFNQISQYALKTIEAAHNLVEETAAKQVVACYHGANTCWVRQAQRYEKQLSTWVQKYEKDMVTSAGQVSGKMRTLAENTALQVANKFELVRSALPGMGKLSSRVHRSKNKVSKQLSKRAAKAQDRARKILRSRQGH